MLGELSAEEGENVVRMAQKHPEVNAELKKIEIGLEAMAQKAKIEPDVKLKYKLLQKLHDESTGGRKLQFRENPEFKPRLGYWRYLVAASILITLFSSYQAYNFYQKWQNTSQQLITLTSQQIQVADNYQKAGFRLNKIENDLAIINDNDFKRIALLGTDNAPQSQSFVYWNQQSMALFLSVKDLKEISGENQFQLWAIIDGKPVDAGLVPTEFNGLVPMKSLTGATAFAITIEPRGGSEQPSLNLMQVYGEVG